MRHGMGLVIYLDIDNGWHSVSREPIGQTAAATYDRFLTYGEWCRQGKVIRGHLTYSPVVWPKSYLVEFGCFALDGRPVVIYYCIDSIVYTVAYCFVGDRL